MSRREALAGLAASATLSARADDKPRRKGRIRQSVASWCFQSAGDKWSIGKLCEVTKALGCASVELVAPADWPTLKKHGLICALAPNGMPGAPFMKGVNNPAYHEEVIKRTKQAIDDCAAAGFPAVIAFTGYQYVKAEDPRSGTFTRADGLENSVKALKELARHAEKKKVTICLEHLNTRDSTHPMKGHPGYQGDDLDWVAGIIRKVASPRVKLLFDIYHVQIMHGDLIRRLEENKDILGHVHTAGSPGRGELDDTQEINYAAVIKKLVALKYKGYVGQEFIPTRKPLEGLRQAVEVCDV